MDRIVFEFDPRAWANDPLLKKCSMSARGLWAYLICFLHHGKPHGHLSTPEPKILAKLEISERQYRRLLAELERNGVFSRTTDGTIFSRRMVREAQRALGDKSVLQRAWLELVDHYPNATMVSLARGVFDSLCADGTITSENVHTLRQGLDRWKASKLWHEDGGKYTPSLYKWLCEKRWLDRPPADAMGGLMNQRSRAGTDPLKIFDPNAEN